MKRSTIVVILTVIGLLVAPFATLAGAPAAEPPPGAELPPASEPPAPPPATDDGANVYCPLPGIVYEGECTIFLDGDLMVSEVATILTIAYAVDPLLGTAPIELPVILRYLKVHTPNIPGIGPVTAIQVGATCSAFVAAERLGDAAYYTCYAILSRAAGNATEHLCPALDKLIDLWLGRAGTAASKKMLETALAAKNAFCFGKTVGIGGIKVLAMLTPAEPPPYPIELWVVLRTPSWSRTIRPGATCKVFVGQRSNESLCSGDEQKRSHSTDEQSSTVNKKSLAMLTPAEPPSGAEPLPEPPPTPEPIANPAAEYPDYCPTVAFTHEDGECVFVLEGEFTTSEVVVLYRAAHDADPFLGASDIDTIMQYLVTRTTTTFGFFPETRILIGKTCRDLADALNGGYVARAGHYSNCVDALARISADFKQLGCPALDALIVRLTALQSAGTIALAQKKTLEGALASYAALCANGR